MRLKAWRLPRPLKDVASQFGLAESTLSEIERGLAFPSIETMCRIDGATRGLVTVADHFWAWRRAHPQEFAELRAEGRARAIRPQRTRRKESTHG